MKRDPGLASNVRISRTRSALRAHEIGHDIRVKLQEHRGTSLVGPATAGVNGQLRRALEDLTGAGDVLCKT
jgi:hypothetical protein